MARRGVCGIVRAHRAGVRRGRAGRWHHGAVRRLFGRGRWRARPCRESGYRDQRARIRAADGAQERKRDETKPPAARGETNRTRVSTADPDASGGSKGPSSGPARPRYPHRRRGPARAGLALVRTASGARRRPPRPHANDRAGATARGKICRDESPAGQDHEGRECARPVNRGGSGAPRVSPVEGLDSAHPAPAGLGDPGA